MNDECIICGMPEHYDEQTNICSSCKQMIRESTTIIYKKVQVHVAHWIPDHQLCGKMHGHTMDIVVGIKGNMSLESGMVMDFKSLKEILQKEIIDRFDHTCLNDILPNPTAEYLAAYIYYKLNQRLINVVTTVRVHETENNYVEFMGDGDV